ncbi:hypothetical protein BOTCAL_0230g00240 [Botryotinia calthae]|uniref:Ubiquitin-like domain-containing protein n=1 Tax=Botryotinia calthae TaxID=38488 RepID=A0A4Y8CXP2_9HELO|nr:hypothetical protein BOTCAL_0230g00240 [Botryotinia calthae]
MAYNAFQSTVVSDDDEDDSNLVNETYRPCKLLYVTTSTGVHSLRTVGPNYRIQLVKSRFIASLMKRGVIPHYGYDCALSYGGRELADSETLESCRIGDEATVNAVVWEENLNSPGFSGHTINSSLRIRHENEQETKQSKRGRSSLDLLVEEDEYEDRVLWRAPASKKQKSVRFADREDPIPHPPTSSRSSSPSQDSSLENYTMSGALELTDRPLEFYDSLVRDSPPRDIPQRRPIVELPRAIIPKTPLRSPTIYRNSVREPETICASYDAFEYPTRPRDAPRRDFHRNCEILRHSDRTSHSRMEYGSSSTAEISSFKPKSLPRQNPSFKDSLASYAPLPSGSPSISNLFIHRYLLSEPSYSSSRPIFKTFPTSTSQHQPSNPYFLRSIPSSDLQSLNSYFSTPSPSPQPFQLPSVLQTLNPYFSNTTPPPPRYPPTPTPSHSPLGSPQSTKKRAMEFDYFQAARYKRSSSPPKLHPLNSPLPSPPPPAPPPPLPQIRNKLPPATFFPCGGPCGGRDLTDIQWDELTPPSPSPRADYLQVDPFFKSALKSKSQSSVPRRYPPPPPPTRPSRLPHFHTPSPYRPPSPNREKKQKQYQPPRISPFYDCYPLNAFSLPKPDSTHPLAFTESPRRTSTNHPATRLTTSKQSYYSSHFPLPTGSSLKGAIVVPLLAHKMLPKDFLAYRTVRQLIKLQGWEMSEGEWRSVREVLKRCKRGENGARGNMEVLAKGVIELEGNDIEMS